MVFFLEIQITEIIIHYLPGLGRLVNFPKVNNKIELPAKCLLD